MLRRLRSRWTSPSYDAVGESSVTLLTPPLNAYLNAYQRERGVAAE